MATDLILSSGYLAFSRHVGFLRAVEESGLEVGAVVGTSSGALVGALWAVGMPAVEVGDLLSARRPILRMRPSALPWRGLLSSGPLLGLLRRGLPATFEELPRPLAVGVVDGEGRHRLLASGLLPEAVAASCAVPILFRPVTVAGVEYRDGGAADRLGLDAWRRWRPGRAALVHRVERSRGRESEASLDGLRVVTTPASGAGLWSLGPFAAQAEEARELAAAVLDGLDAV